MHDVEFDLQHTTMRQDHGYSTERFFQLFKASPGQAPSRVFGTPRSPYNGAPQPGVKTEFLSPRSHHFKSPYPSLSPQHQRHAHLGDNFDFGGERPASITPTGAPLSASHSTGTALHSIGTASHSIGTAPHSPETALHSPEIASHSTRQCHHAATGQLSQAPPSPRNSKVGWPPAHGHPGDVVSRKDQLDGAS
jgi:hypothetical protein